MFPLADFEAFYEHVMAENSDNSRLMGEEEPPTEQTNNNVRGNNAHLINQNGDRGDNLGAVVFRLLEQNQAMMGIIREGLMHRPQQPAPVVIPNLAPNVIECIPDFFGHEGPEKARTWLSSVQTSVQLHNWTTNIAFEVARSHLKGSARNWYDARVDELINWDILQDAFRRTFIYERSLTDTWRDMMERIQGVNEGAGDYFHHKVKLCRRLGLTDREIRTQVARGLRSRNMADFILAKPFNDIDELLRSILDYERDDRERRVLFSQRGNQSRNLQEPSYGTARATPRQQPFTSTQQTSWRAPWCPPKPQPSQPP